jgi:hypothetical protein
MLRTSTGGVVFSPAISSILMNDADLLGMVMICGEGIEHQINIWKPLFFLFLLLSVLQFGTLDMK